MKSVKRELGRCSISEIWYQVRHDCEVKVWIRVHTQITSNVMPDITFNVKDRVKLEIGL